MIRITAELISAVNKDRSRVLGTMEICNDGTGDLETGNYRGTLHAEYTPKDGRRGHISNFRRQRQSVWSLVGAFLKLWGHTKHTAPTRALSELETRLLIDCAYWRARAAGVTLSQDLSQIVRAVLDECKVPGVATDAEGLEIIKKLTVRMLFDTPAIPPAPKASTNLDDY